ncbi:MAG: polyphosphate:AMP phosphotransferase [Acidobacteriota bacterium]
MLEVLNLKAHLDKERYRELISPLQRELRDVQQMIRREQIPIVVLLEGWDASGKGDSIGNLVHPLDPRGFKVFTTRGPNEEEHFRPYLWRFWVKLPRTGDFVFLDRGWYRRLLQDRLSGEIDEKSVLVAAGEIREFERQLTDDGYVLIKLWLHVSKQEQKRRLKTIESDPYERWRVARRKSEKRPGYKKCLKAAEEMLALTSTANAPWLLVEADDRLYRRVKVLEGVVSSLKAALASRGLALTGASPQEQDGTLGPLATGSRDVEVQRTNPPNLLDRVDLDKRLSRAEYNSELDRLQMRLRELELECYNQRVAAVVVYEGWDAAGKGGNIKRLTQELDPRGYEVIPVSAPDETEKAHHYLWRFWRALPKAGHIAIFDRSWYGRVLVERVEGLAAEVEWRRAYQEINEFERHITASGAVLIKFWLHLSPEEQLRRFEEREKTPHKRHKITPDDWRNRQKWNVYREAVVEMIERTSTPYGPWTIVEAEDKLWARIRTLSTLVARLEQRLGLS